MPDPKKKPAKKQMKPGPKQRPEPAFVPGPDRFHLRLTKVYREGNDIVMEGRPVYQTGEYDRVVVRLARSSADKWVELRDIINDAT